MIRDIRVLQKTRNDKGLQATLATKTIANSFMADTFQMIYIDNNPNARMLSALSAAWFWDKNNIGDLADKLKFSGIKDIKERKAFDKISTAVGGTEPADRWNNYTLNMDKIRKGGNPYEEMTDALKKLGITTKSATNYETQFGISLAKRTRVGIQASHLIMADTPIIKKSVLDRASALVAQAQKNLNLNEGEFTMWLADAPTNTISPPAIYLTANVSSAQVAGGDTSHKLGVCKIVAGVEAFYPMFDAVNYFASYTHIFNSSEFANFEYYSDGSERKDTSIRIIEQPKHGSIILNYVDETGYTHPDYHYTPDEGYEDFDYFVMEVKAGDNMVQINYTIQVNNLDEPRTRVHDDGQVVPYDDSCPQEMWRISTIDNTYSNISYTFTDLLGNAIGETTGEGANATITLDTDAAGHGWYIGGLTTEDRGQNLNTPSSIFNPLSSVFSPPSSDWLPTSNPFEWVARAGTAVEGKMDMLSVLLHEYGHALGIEHSSDAHDYMATTLTPGLRRLPNVIEMQLMAQLAAEARAAIVAGQGYTLTVANNIDTDTPHPSPLPQGARELIDGRGKQDLPTLPINMGFGVSFLGLLRRNSPRPLVGEGLGERGSKVAQYDIASNTTLTNGNFAITPTPALPLTGGGSLSGWETTGKVTVEPANPSAGSGQTGATLSEVASSQTRLNQVFVVGADDRYLSFTLSNIGLKGKSALSATSTLSPTPLPQGEGLPSDAFEVALLNANKGASLTAPIGLTRSDALLNIQANGNELKATGVTSVVNADVSRTYVVDLSGIAVGTAVNLSFDLIGFGNTPANTNSHVTVRDVRLKPAIIIPQLSNDAATGAEDTVMQIIALANDVNIVQANRITKFLNPVIPAQTGIQASIKFRVAALFQHSLNCTLTGYQPPLV